jgi:copper(I)-binding protein
VSDHRRRGSRWVPLLALAAVVVPACGADGGSTAVSVGDMTVTDPWVRPTPPGVTEAAIYLAIRNAGDDDRLLGARSDRCISVPVHATTIDDAGVARMRELTGDELDLPSGGSLALSPNGIHLMCVELDGRLEQGDTVDVDLVFERHPTVPITVEVDAR